MPRRSYELWAALAAIIFITLGYVLVVTWLGSTPAASGLFGHTLGVVGFLLMLMTEILYSLRKRTRTARWGQMSTWLQFHIFTGLVGPYLVLLHTAWKLNGVAAMATLLMLIVVFSGFIGRYIYTAVPRSADGLTLEAGALRHQLEASKESLQRWLAAQPGSDETLTQSLDNLLETPRNGLMLFWIRPVLRWHYRFHWWRTKQRLQALGYIHLHKLDNLLDRHHTLQRQVASLAVARQMLALWHSIHVPLGVTLFVLAFIHIGAALYYATLLK